MKALHTPSCAPILPKRGKETTVRNYLALCYVHPDDTVEILSFSNMRKSIWPKAWLLADKGEHPLDRLYIWDTSGPWMPHSLSHWTPIMPRGTKQWTFGT